MKTTIMNYITNRPLKSWTVFFMLFLMLSIFGIGWISSSKQEISLSPYPDGKNFAFTITDDPDYTSLEKVKPLYDFLADVGLRTTIAVWVKEAERSDGIPDRSGLFHYGDTCQRKDYLAYIRELRKRGFEIAIHTVSAGNDSREVTIEGYEEFKGFFGEYPKINIMHSNNLENIYWGEKVFRNGFLRKMVSLLYNRAKFPYGGEEPNSPYFWGDILKEKTKYVRLWGTSDINTLKFNPSMPYHDPQKPYVNYWFSFSDGYLLPWFNKLISDKNIQKLVKERGASIVYTHFAEFTRKDETGVYRLDGDFVRQIKKIAQQKDGWFVPASVLLDRLLRMKNVSLFSNDNAIVIINANTSDVYGVTLLTKPGEVFYNSHGFRFDANNEGEIILGDLKPGEVVTLFSDKNRYFLRNEFPSFFEYINLVFRRSLILIFSHKG